MEAQPEVSHGMRKSWGKADNVLPITFGHMMKCLFIWQIPRRSAGEN